MSYTTIASTREILLILKYLGALQWSVTEVNLIVPWQRQEK